MNKLKGESINEFEQRKLFLNFLLSKNIKDNEKLSKIWCNIIFRNCKYSSQLYHYIMKLDKEFKETKEICN